LYSSSSSTVYIATWGKPHPSISRKLVGQEVSSSLIHESICTTIKFTFILPFSLLLVTPLFILFVFFLLKAETELLDTLHWRTMCNSCLEFVSHQVSAMQFSSQHQACYVLCCFTWHCKTGTVLATFFVTFSSQWMLCWIGYFISLLITCSDLLIVTYGNRLFRASFA